MDLYKDPDQEDLLILVDVANQEVVLSFSFKIFLKNHKLIICYIDKI